MGEPRTATVLAANRPPPTPPPVRDAACGGGEAFHPAGASAVADSLQELSLPGVTHCPEVPPHLPYWFKGHRWSKSGAAQAAPAAPLLTALYMAV